MTLPMQSGFDKVLEKLEALRSRLLEVSQSHRDLTDEAVLSVSQELDHVILDLYRLMPNRLMPESVRNR